MLAPVILALALPSAGPPGPPEKTGKPAEAVVLVSASLRMPNALRPWAKSKAVEVAGTGVLLPGGVILTNAHLVDYASEAHVQAAPGGEKFAARVASIGSDVDLAVLTVTDRRFFKRRKPLARSSALPSPRDTVEVYGFPVGGSEMSVTRGVVSRIGYSPVANGMVIQVSAAVNEGNSGGPAVVGGKMVGIVFSRLRQAEGIGYVIPNEEIDQYLLNVRGGRYLGKFTDATQTHYQALENDALRAMLKLDDKVGGILAMPPRGGEPGNPFRDYDVLTHVGRHAIDRQGMVKLPGGQRVPFYAVMNQEQAGGAAPLRVLRGGKAVRVSLPLTRQAPLVVPAFRGEQPEWFIHGPLAFSPARYDAIRGYMTLNPRLDPSSSPLLLRRSGRTRFPGEELVVVTHPMFDHKVRKGYADPVGQVLDEVNGQKIKNLRHLVEVLRDCKDEFLRLRFAERHSEVLVFRRAEMEKATEEVMEEAGISPSRRGSPAMMKVWKERRPAVGK